MQLSAPETWNDLVWKKLPWWLWFILWLTNLFVKVRLLEEPPEHFGGWCDRTVIAVLFHWWHEFGGVHMCMYLWRDLESQLVCFHRKGRPSTCDNTGYPSCARIPLRMILLFWASQYIRYGYGIPPANEFARKDLRSILRGFDRNSRAYRVISMSHIYVISHSAPQHIVFAGWPSA